MRNWTIVHPQNNKSVTEATPIWVKDLRSGTVKHFRGISAVADWFKTLNNIPVNLRFRGRIREVLLRPYIQPVGRFVIMSGVKHGIKDIPHFAECQWDDTDIRNSTFFIRHLYSEVPIECKSGPEASALIGCHYTGIDKILKGTRRSNVIHGWVVGQTKDDLEPNAHYTQPTHAYKRYKYAVYDATMFPIVESETILNVAEKINVPPSTIRNAFSRMTSQDANATDVSVSVRKGKYVIRRTTIR